MTIDAEHGAGRVSCYICRQRLEAEEEVFLVPASGNDYRLWQNNEPYDYATAHPGCIGTLIDPLMKDRLQFR